MFMNIMFYFNKIFVFDFFLIKVDELLLKMLLFMIVILMFRVCFEF